MHFIPVSPFRRFFATSFAIGICFLPAWAEPASREVAGVKNFHIVNDRVFRGGQPTEAGFRSLQSMGVHTILDLRESGPRADAEKKLVKRLGMSYVNVPMKGMTTPTERQISSALAVLNDSNRGPVFVHCKRGADRTGAVVACYRIGHDHITNEQALAEARDLGMSVFQFQIKAYVARFQPHGPELAGETPAPSAGAVPARPALGAVAP